MSEPPGAGPSRTGGGEVWQLRLYVAGQTPRSLRAVSNLEQLCQQHQDESNEGCEIEIIDLVEHPGLAGRDGIEVIPTLVRRSPAPGCRVLGDLSDTEQVLIDLRGPPGTPS